MVTNGTARPARSGVSALGRLAAGVAAVAVSTLLAPAIGEDQPGVGGPGRGEEAPASTCTTLLLVEADAPLGSSSSVCRHRSSIAVEDAMVGGLGLRHMRKQ